MIIIVLLPLYAMYEGCFNGSDLHLVALFRDIHEPHTMYHSKALYFTFIMMLISSRCTVSLNNNTILFIPLICFHFIEL